MSKKGRKRWKRIENVIYNVSKINSQVQIIMKYNVFIYLSIQEKTACCYLLIIIHLPVNTYLFIIYWLHHNFLNFSTNHFSYKKLVSRQFLIISIKICARKSWEIFVSPLLFFFFQARRKKRRGKLASVRKGVGSTWTMTFPGETRAYL